MSAHIIVGLDIGTSAIKVAVAERQEKHLVPRLLLKEPVRGLRRGAIVDMAEVTGPVSRVLQEAKKFSRSALKNLYVNIGTAQVKAQASRGIIAVSRADTEIYPDDVDKAVRASQAVTLAPNRMIIHNIVREFIVDGVADIAEPLGLSGNRLEVNSLIIDAFAAHVKSVIKVVELTGGEIGGLVFNPLAAARAALSKTQRDLGVALVDLGAGTTGLAVYEENKLVGAANFPVGAANISNDLAIGLKIPVDAAERTKILYGYAMAKEVGVRENVDLKKAYPEAKDTVSRRFLADIIESRLEEIFELIFEEIKAMGKMGQLAGGVVLTGGGAKLPGVTELARQELKLSAQIGLPAGQAWQVETGEGTRSFEDPEFMTALGLVEWGLEQGDGGVSLKLPSLKPRDILRYFLP